MNIEFLRWMCEKAEGFRVVIFPNIIQVQIPFYEHLKNLDEVEIYMCKDRWSLLYQRAVEGVNRDNPEWLQISQCGYSLQILTDCNRDVVKHFEILGDTDQAKEQALMYIWEQEK